MMPKIAIIDDEEIYCLLLKEQANAAGLDSDCYTNFSDFFSQLEDTPHMYALVITDWLVGSDDAISGKFPAACRYYGYQGAVMLYSNHICRTQIEKLEVAFDKAMAKGDPIDWEKIARISLEKEAALAP